MTLKQFHYILSQKEALSSDPLSYIHETLYYHFDLKSRKIQVRGRIPYSFVSSLQSQKEIISLPNPNYTSNECMVEYIKNADKIPWLENAVRLNQIRTYYLTHLPDQIYYSIITLDDEFALMIWLKEWNKYFEKHEDKIQSSPIKQKKR